MANSERLPGLKVLTVVTRSVLSMWPKMKSFWGVPGRVICLEKPFFTAVGFCKSVRE